MTGWREFIYCAPDSGGCALERVIEALPVRLGLDLTCLPYGGFRLRVADPVAAMFLRMSVGGLGVADDAYPFLDPGDLYVPDVLRPICEQELATRCQSSAIWQELIWAEFRTDEARAAFEQVLKDDEVRSGRQ